MQPCIDCQKIIHAPSANVNAEPHDRLRSFGEDRTTTLREHSWLSMRRVRYEVQARGATVWRGRMDATAVRLPVNRACLRIAAGFRSFRPRRTAAVRFYGVPG
jgi:hypothetical protein